MGYYSYLCKTYYKNNVEAFRYYLALKSGQFQPLRIMGKSFCACVVIYLPQKADYIHSLGVGLLSIIEWRAVQSLNAIIFNSPHASLF